MNIMQKNIIFLIVYISTVDSGDRKGISALKNFFVLPAYRFLKYILFSKLEKYVRKTSYERKGWQMLIYLLYSTYLQVRILFVKQTIFQKLTYL